MPADWIIPQVLTSVHATGQQRFDPNDYRYHYATIARIVVLFARVALLPIHWVRFAKSHDRRECRIKESAGCGQYIKSLKMHSVYALSKRLSTHSLACPWNSLLVSISNLSVLPLFSGLSS